MVECVKCGKPAAAMGLVLFCPDHLKESNRKAAELLASATHVENPGADPGLTSFRIQREQVFKWLARTGGWISVIDLQLEKGKQADRRCRELYPPVLRDRCRHKTRASCCRPDPSREGVRATFPAAHPRP